MNEVLNTEEIVSAYLAIRAERERILREYEVADTALKSDMSRLEAVLLEACNAVNADSIKTTYGTVMRKLNERAYCTDWDSFRKFELEHPDYDFREKRIHQGNFKTFIEDHADSGLPPGVSVMREFGVSVRKASSR